MIVASENNWLIWFSILSFFCQGFTSVELGKWFLLRRPDILWKCAVVYIYTMKVILCVARVCRRVCISLVGLLKSLRLCSCKKCWTAVRIYWMTSYWWILRKIMEPFKFRLRMYENNEHVLRGLNLHTRFHDRNVSCRGAGARSPGRPKFYMSTCSIWRP